jgi:hypothetical protein
VRCHLDVAKEGKVELKVAGPIEHVWLDAKPLELADVLALDLTTGVHTLSMTVRDESNSQLRAELGDVSGSNAQVQFLGGK